MDINKGNEIMSDVFKKYGRIDGLVNNAGISLHEWDFLKVTEQDFDMQFNTNFKGGYFLTQNYIKNVTENNQRGNIIFISSEFLYSC